ncbi:HAMP domain-containing sensor histidine kinase [Sorangium sp. So ce429]
MAAALDEQRRRQLGILASVAHDLRNPLAALKLTVDRLRPDRPLPPEERLRPMLARIGQEAARCDRMLTDLMDIARLEGGELELRCEVRDARELAQEVVELYRPTATAHELGLSLPEEPAPLRCDPIRIGQVPNNLIANAIKYSPRGGAVQVAVAREGAEITIAVSDRGVGIAADDQGRLFERYFRAPSSGTRTIFRASAWASKRKSASRTQREVPTVRNVCWCGSGGAAWVVVDRLVSEQPWPQIRRVSCNSGQDPDRGNAQF